MTGYLIFEKVKDSTGILLNELRYISRIQSDQHLPDNYKTMYPRMWWVHGRGPEQSDKLHIIISKGNPAIITIGDKLTQSEVDNLAIVIKKCSVNYEKAKLLDQIDAICRSNIEIQINYTDIQAQV